MSNPESKSPAISIVIPVYNEEGNLKPLWQRLESATEALKASCEILFVDDGSTDGSFTILSELHDHHPAVRVIRLRKNFGQHPATIAGFDHARGDWILTLDADLQNDPQDLLAIYQKLREGYDVVAGVRIHRTDPLLRRKLPSRLVNRFIAKHTGLVQTDTGCFLKGYTQQAAREVAEFTDIGGFITATIGVLGFRYAELPVHHAERHAGESRYGLLTQLDQFMSIFTGYARRPFQVIELIGLAIVGLGFLASLLSVCGIFQPLIIHLLLGLIVLTLGLILGSVGVVGEYIVRTSRLVRRSPRYLIAEKLE